MSATFDGDISVQINLDAPPVTGAGFGTVLLACITPPGFSGTLVKVYTSAQEAAQDNDLTAAVQAALNTAFAQAGVEQVKVGDASAGGLTDQLAAIAAEDNDWYGLVLDSRVTLDNLDAATWAEANEKLFVAQSSDPDILNPGDTDLASVLMVSARLRSTVLWHHDDAEWAALAWAVDRLAADPDVTTTIWKFATLAGITPSSVTSTQKAEVLSKKANLYLTFGGQGSSGPGTLADGHKIDELITADWLRVRLTERFQQVLLGASNRREKIPYTDAGFEVFGNEARAQLTQGEEVGHFEPGSSFVRLPALSKVASATRQARHLEFALGARPAGAIEGASITGYVSLSI